jgi:hypothetical protein
MDYLPIDADGSSLLFQLIARRYEQGSTIVNSNLSFGHWGSFLENDVVASAILDRLLHHGSIVNLRGESYRLKDKRRAGLIGSATDLRERRTSGQPDRDRSLQAKYESRFLPTTSKPAIWNFQPEILGNLKPEMTPSSGTLISVSLSSRYLLNSDGRPPA